MAEMFYRDADHFDVLCRQYRDMYNDYLRRFGIMESFIRKTMEREGLSEHLIKYAKPSSLQDRMIMSVRWNMLYPYERSNPKFDSQEADDYCRIYGAELTVIVNGFIDNYTLNACFTYRDFTNIMAFEHKDIPDTKIWDLKVPEWFVTGVKGVVEHNKGVSKLLAAPAEKKEGILKRIKQILL